MKKEPMHILMSTLLCVLTLAVFLAYYYRLPQSVPVHFDFHGNPNSYWPRDLLVFGGPAAYSIINLLVAFQLMEHKKKSFSYYITPILAFIVTGIVIALALQ